MASTGPSLVLPASAGPTTDGGPGGLDGIERVGLALVAPGLPVGPVDLDDLDALPAQEPGPARPIGTGAFDADLGHLTEALEPDEQRLVASSVGIERLGADQSTQRVEGCGDVFIEVGVDTTRDPGQQLLRWSWPSLPSLAVEGWHGRPRSERRAVGLLVASRTNHPTSETGRAVVNVPLEELGRRRPRTPHDHKSGRISQYSRSY